MASLYSASTSKTCRSRQRGSRNRSTGAASARAAIHPELAAECERVALATAKIFHLDGISVSIFILELARTAFRSRDQPRLTTSFAGLKMLHPESLLRFIAGQRGGKPANMPGSPKTTFAAYKIVSLPVSSAVLYLEQERYADHQLLWVGMPGGGVSAFISARGQTRAAAIENLGRLGARLYSAINTSR